MVVQACDMYMYIYMYITEPAVKANLCLSAKYIAIENLPKQNKTIQFWYATYT